MANIFVSKLKFNAYNVQQLKYISEDVMKKGIERFENDTITDIQIKNVIKEFEKFYQEYSDLQFLQKCDYSVLCDEFAINFFKDKERKANFNKPKRSMFSTFYEFQEIIINVIDTVPELDFSGENYKYPFIKNMTPYQPYSFNAAINLFNQKRLNMLLIQ